MPTDGGDNSSPPRKGVAGKTRDTMAMAVDWAGSTYTSARMVVEVKRGEGAPTEAQKPHSLPLSASAFLRAT